MSATKSKVDLSLDEIIKNNKKGPNVGKRNVRRGVGNAVLRKKGQGVLKRKSTGTPKRTVLKRGNKSIGKKNNQAGPSTVNNPATRRLVNNLVKKALKQVTTARGPKVGAVRNVIRGRRGAVRNRGGQARNNASLNRVSQRSRVIGRSPRMVNRAPITVLANRSGRANRSAVMTRREPNPIQAQLNFLRRQQQQTQRPQLARVPVIRQQPRRQIPVQRRQVPRVIYVQPQRSQPVRRQPQQIIVVQQQPRRQFSRGGQYSRGGGGGQFSRGGQFPRGGRRPQRQNNDPFFDPPNFLQRIPAAQSFGRGGRGGRFIEF